MKNVQMLHGFSKFCFHTPYLMTQCTSAYSPPPGFQTLLLFSVSGELCLLHCGRLPYHGEDWLIA